MRSPKFNAREGCPVWGCRSHQSQKLAHSRLAVRSGKYGIKTMTMTQKAPSRQVDLRLIRSSPLWE